MYRVYKRLTEAPIPDDWDSQKINTSNTSKKKNFRVIIDSILEKAKKLGAGTSRIAFEINQPGFEHTVIKVAKNEKGLAQNRLEAEITSQSYYSHVVPNLIDEDESSSTYERTGSPLWIQVEKATKASPKDIRKYLGISEIYSLEGYFRRNSQQSARYNFGINNEKDRDILNENERIQDMVSLMNDYDLASADLGRLANLGFIDGELVIIDTGASNDIIKTYYSR
jgi:hypothetical protein